MGRKLHSHLSFLLPGVEERVEHPRGGKRSVMTEGLRSRNLTWESASEKLCSRGT